ncbi:hypothetical protein Droror1_Dr00005428 [Drosera rotundifolia]
MEISASPPHKPQSPPRNLRRTASILDSANSSVNSTTVTVDSSSDQSDDFSGGSEGEFPSSCTENLGSESSNDEATFNGELPAPAKIKKAGGGGDQMDDDGDSSVSVSVRVFPPLLTTLNVNGRPMFHLMKERECDGGRLVISMSRIAREMVRFVGDDGRLKMRMTEQDDELDGEDYVSDDDYGDDDDDDVKATEIGC